LTLRGEPKKLRPVNFAFVEKTQACFSVCRSGNAGYATTQFQNKNKSHYFFIKILDSKLIVSEIVSIINRTKMIERDFNIGAPTINKQELTYYLNKIFTRENVDDFLF